MRIPRTVKIGGVVYTVKQGVILRDIAGLLDRCDTSILISSDLGDGNKEITFLHEILHALNGELPESVVDSLAAGLHQVFTDNNILIGGKNGKGK